MNIVINVVFLISFFGFLILIFRMLLDSNLDKFFKQGKVGSIRIMYILVSIVGAFLMAFCLKELTSAFYSFFN